MRQKKPNLTVIKSHLQLSIKVILGRPTCTPIYAPKLHMVIVIIHIEMMASENYDNIYDKSCQLKLNDMN